MVDDSPDYIHSARYPSFTYVFPNDYFHTSSTLLVLGRLHQQTRTSLVLFNKEVLSGTKAEPAKLWEMTEL